MDETGGGRVLLEEGGRAFEASHDGDRASVAVVRAIAAVEGVPVTEVTIPLREYVDPEALDRLFGRSTPPASEADLTVAFSVETYRITVRADGTLRVAHAADA